MKEYFEAHVTMLGEPKVIGPIVAKTGWKFSAIDGDINLGDGTKCYATRQFNKRIGKEKAIEFLHSEADTLIKCGFQVLRRKIEIVIYDDRQGACTGACPECVS